MGRLQQALLALTCLVAATSYAGSVTAFALVAYVLPGVAGAVLLAAALSARRLGGTALIVGSPLVLGWGELVNIWSGSGDGPAARSTVVAAGCSLLAVVAAGSPSPALFLAPLAGSVCGALLLGAGSQVRSVAVATAVCAALTLGAIERQRRNWTRSPRRGAALVVLSLLAGAVAVAVVLLQVQRDSRPPEALAAGRAYPGIEAPWPDPLGVYEVRSGGPSASTSLAAPAPQSTRLPRSATRPRSDGARPPAVQPPQRTGEQPPAGRASLRAATREQPPRVRSHSPRTRAQATRPSSQAARRHRPPARTWLYVLAAVLAVVLLLVLAVAARLLAVRLAWRRVRRRLARGSRTDQITGAWAWLRLRLEACRLPLAASVSPDVFAAGRLGDDLLPPAAAPLGYLAQTAEAAAFADWPPLAPADVVAAWKAARLAEAAARARLTRSARLRAAFRSPDSLTAVR